MANQYIPKGTEYLVHSPAAPLKKEEFGWIPGENILRDIISDEAYYTLREHGLLDEKGLRDYHIRKRFRELRDTMQATEAIEILQKQYPYLQYDTLRKIVYQMNPRRGKKPC